MDIPEHDQSCLILKVAIVSILPTKSLNSWAIPAGMLGELMSGAKAFRKE